MIFTSQLTKQWNGNDCQTQITMNALKLSGICIVQWPRAITIKFRARKQTTKPQTKINDYPCCLQFSFLTPQWLFLRNTIIFRKIIIPGVHGSVSFTVSHAESYRRNDYIYFPLIHSTFMIRRTTTVAFVCQLCFLPHGRPVILAPHSF